MACDTHIACTIPHLHSNLTEKIVLTDKFKFDCKFSKRYVNGKIVKQRIICFSNMQIRYLKDLPEPCMS